MKTSEFESNYKAEVPPNQKEDDFEIFRANTIFEFKKQCAVWTLDETVKPHPKKDVPIPSASPLAIS
jgi:hypothetical protein